MIEQTFIEGEQYNKKKDIHDIYDGQRQQGIITPANHPLIFLINTSSGKKYGYENEWSDDGQIFFYYAGGQYGDMQLVRQNKNLRDHKMNNKRVYGFDATIVPNSLICLGEFECIGYDEPQIQDVNGNLRKGIRFHLQKLSHEEYDESIDIDNKNSSMSLSDLRKRAINAASYKSNDTNPNIVSQEIQKRKKCIKDYVLARAKGFCEYTDEFAPFKRKNGEPFLEVHHILSLSDDGLDHPINCAAISPNIHKEIHYGERGNKINDELQKKIKAIEDMIDT